MALTYRSERARVESAIGPAMLLRVADHLNAGFGADRPALPAIADAFRLAMLAPTREMPTRERQRIERRTMAARIAALDAMGGSTIASAYAAVVRWLEAVTAAGLVQLEAGEFAEAFDRLWEEVTAAEGDAALIDRVDGKSRKRAAALHGRLRRAGYFPGPDPFAPDPTQLSYEKNNS